MTTSFFSFLRKASPQLQLYGKLPIAKDYLRIGCAEGTARELRDWADRVFSARVAGDAPRLAYPCRFVFAGQNSPPVAGCVWPSSDAGGLRPFPFFLLVERSKKSLVAEWRNGPLEAGGAWRRFEELWPELARHADGESLLAALRGIQIEESPEDDDHAAQESVDFTTWRRALWPERGEEELSALIGRIHELAARAPRSVRLPLVSDVAITPQVQGWWSLACAARMMDPTEPPTAFFPIDKPTDGVPACVMFARGEPDDARWFAERSAAPLGPGDLGPMETRRAGSREPMHENTPPLADSLRGALAQWRVNAPH